MPGLSLGNLIDRPLSMPISEPSARWGDELQMSENVGLTRRQEAAAQLVAKGSQTHEALAAQLGINSQTLLRWRRQEAFTTRIQALQDAMAAAVVSEGIALRTKRVAALNDRWNRMQRVIDERAEDPEVSHVPGGTTGLMVHTVKMIGGGRDATTVDEYAVDVGLLKELRAHEEQAAKELGQWTEKQEHTGEVLIRRYEGVDVDDV